MLLFPQEKRQEEKSPGMEPGTAEAHGDLSPHRCAAPAGHARTLPSLPAACRPHLKTFPSVPRRALAAASLQHRCSVWDELYPGEVLAPWPYEAEHVINTHWIKKWIENWMSTQKSLWRSDSREAVEKCSLPLRSESYLRHIQHLPNRAARYFP